MIGEIAIQSAIGFALAGAVLGIAFCEWRKRKKYVHVDAIEWCDCDGGSGDE